MFELLVSYFTDARAAARRAAMDTVARDKAIKAIDDVTAKAMFVVIFIACRHSLPSYSARLEEQLENGPVGLDKDSVRGLIEDISAKGAM